MYGVDWRTPSSTIALCPTYWTTVFGWLLPSWPASPGAILPRSYSSFVILWNSCAPCFLKERGTSACPESEAMSALMPDSLRSCPVISGGPFGCAVDVGKYLKTYQALPLVEPTI